MTLTSYFKYIAILSLLSFYHIKGTNPQVSISYNDVSVDKALQKLVTDYEVPIIYPSKIANQYVSIDCYDCDIETVLNIILSKIDYDWKDKNILILGSGGSSKAIRYALSSNSSRTHIASRKLVNIIREVIKKWQNNPKYDNLSRNFYIFLTASGEGVNPSGQPDRFFPVFFYYFP